MEEKEFSGPGCLNGFGVVCDGFPKLAPSSPRAVLKKMEGKIQYTEHIEGEDIRYGRTLTSLYGRPINGGAEALPSPETFIACLSFTLAVDKIAYNVMKKVHQLF